MKRKPMALTVLILVGAYIGRRLLLVQLLTLMPWLNPKSLVPILVGGSLTVASCFFKARVVHVAWCRANQVWCRVGMV